MRKANTIEDVWKSIEVLRPDECWPWLRPTLDGYGRMRLSGKQPLSHRLVWELTYGPIPEGMEVCHSCDHPWCNNPSHFFLGTHLDNMKDRDAKGRLVINAQNILNFDGRGENNGRAKLTELDVCTIRTSSKRAKDIADDFNVSKELIYKIRSREVWSHVA